ncbi:hypothetical protein VTN96DRAFT_10236 [Rasamsonia emersonii]
MLPPSDSIGHQYRKLAEALADAQQNRSTSSVPPPPPYSSAVKTSSSDTTNADYDYDDDEDVFLEEDTSPRAPPITIKIDASISVVGDRNTITIPVSRLVRSGSNSDGSGSNDNNGSAMQTQCPNRSQQSSSPSSPTKSGSESGSESGSARQATAYLQRFQQQRHTQHAELANTMLAGLNSAGLLTDQTNGGNQSRRRVDIEINSGIRIHGLGNVVCAGVLPRSMARNTTNANTSTNPERDVPSSSPPAAPPASLSETKKERNPTSSGDPAASPMEPSAQRKRSNSEPLMPPQTKIQKTV